MLNPELWTEGSITMLVGMGIVFSFLVILVFAMMIMAKCVCFINKLCPVAVEEIKTKSKNTSDDSETALAIAIAKAQA